MKKIGFCLLAISTIAFLSSCAQRSKEVPSDQLPMYGNLPRTTEQVKKDSDYTDGVVAQTGDKKKAVESILKEAWDYQDKGYLELAMVRFNQAWLMDPQEADVYYGFGLVLTQRGKTDEALKMYIQGLSLNPSHAMMLCRIARLYQNKSVEIIQKKGEQEGAFEAKSYMDQALASYEKASQSTEVQKDLSYIYYQWAVCLAVTKDYKGAWDKVHLSQAYGGEFIEKGFVKSLSQDMPEPNP